MQSIHYKIIMLRYQICPENAIDFVNTDFPKDNGKQRSGNNTEQETG